MTRIPLKTIITHTSNTLTTWHVNYISIKLLLKKKKQARKKLCNNIMTHDCWGSWLSSEEGAG